MVPSSSATSASAPQVVPALPEVQVVAVETAIPSVLPKVSPQSTTPSMPRAVTASASAVAPLEPQPVACVKRLGADGLWRLEPEGCTQ